jgi:hypothetical protein
MAHKQTPAQQATIAELKTDPPGARVDFFEAHMDGNTLLVQRTLRVWNLGGVSSTTDQMYRIHPDGAKQRV